jgi:hypothetical protein
MNDRTWTCPIHGQSVTIGERIAYRECPVCGDVSEGSWWTVDAINEPKGRSYAPSPTARHMARRDTDDEAARLARGRTPLRRKVLYAVIAIAILILLAIQPYEPRTGEGYDCQYPSGKWGTCYR